jgi:hypothetical protein
MSAIPNIKISVLISVVDEKLLTMKNINRTNQCRTELQANIK